MKCDVIAAGIVSAAKGVGSTATLLYSSRPLQVHVTTCPDLSHCERGCLSRPVLCGKSHTSSVLPCLLDQLIGGLLWQNCTVRSTVFCMQVGVQVPLIVRLEGTNVEKGKEILSNSDVTIITADDLDDAATKAVKSIQ